MAARARRPTAWARDALAPRSPDRSRRPHPTTLSAHTLPAPMTSRSPSPRCPHPARAPPLLPARLLPEAARHDELLAHAQRVLEHGHALGARGRAQHRRLQRVQPLPLQRHADGLLVLASGQAPARGRRGGGGCGWGKGRRAGRRSMCVGGQSAGRVPSRWGPASPWVAT